MNIFLPEALPLIASFCVSEPLVSMMFLLLTCLYAVPLQTQDTLKDVKVSLMLKDATVREAINILEKQSNLKFFYRSDRFDAERKVTLDFRGNLEEALQLILGEEITYVVSGKHIILKKKSMSETNRHDRTEKNHRDSLELQSSKSALNYNMESADREVGGIVTDEANVPLPGVNVVVKGTSIGTTTDQNGTYKINVSDISATLLFSFIGYATVEAPVRSHTTVDISLQPHSRTLNEIVVVGYGSVKKSDLTGAVSSISKKDLGDRQVSDIASLIQGRATGVDVSQGTIRIRGITTFNNSDPLVVIDGFLGGNLATVNANDIENIEILKDASSTAIYGSRGANGVILITTKNGEPGPLKINVNYYEGISQVPKKLAVMNANQYTDFALEILSNAGHEARKLLSDQTRVDRTDWQEEVFKTGQNRELNVDFSGGSERGNYFLGMGYRRTENPTFLGMANDNIYLRNKNNVNVTRWLKAGNNFAFTYNNFTGGGEGGNPGNLDHTINAPPHFPVKDSIGNYSTPGRKDIPGMRNPLITASNNHIEGSSLSYQVALWAEVEPIKGLTYKIQAGVGGDFGRDQTSNDSYTGGIAGEATLPTRITKTNFYNFSPIVEQYITYRGIVREHQFSIMAGNTWQDGSTGGLTSIFGQDLDLSIPNVVGAPTNLVTEDGTSKQAYLSYFGRFIYQLKNKYLVTMNMRADGSPRFAPANRWGTFPSVAVAWKLHEENVFKTFNFFDELKLRGGWGLSGNDAVGEFRYLSKVYTRNVYYQFGVQEGRHNGATILNDASYDIKWELAETTSIGVDIALLNNKLTVVADFYSKKTSDILYEVPQRASLGYGDSDGNGSAIVNAASMVNRGVELQLGYRSNIRHLNFSLNANYTHNKNKVTSLGDGSYLDGINRTDTSNPVGYFYGFVADGIFMTQAELDQANAAAREKGFSGFQLATTSPGDVRFRDINGNGQVDNDDRIKIGSPHPSHIFGLNLNLDFKGFDFTMFLQGILGSSIYDGNYDKVRGGSVVLNQSTYVLNRWLNESNPGNGIVPRAVLGDPAQNNRQSTLKLSDGDYLKIRQISLGYSLPKPFSKRLGVDNLRIYCSAYNYVTFSKYKYGYDPEVGGTNLSRGIDSGNSWPRPKMVMVGFQARF
jgi:TonB-linked SusC/RagA family outer membrane protein